MLSVAINGSVLRRGVSGSARLVGLLADALQGADGASVRVLRPGGARRASRLGRLVSSLGWDLWGFPIREPADVYVAATNVAPLWSRGRPVATVVHDVMVLDLPRLFDRGYQLVSRGAFQTAARFSDVIVTPSRFSRAGVLERLRPRCEVVVIPHGIEDCWFTGPKRAAPTQTVLTVGSTAPRKRLHLAVEAVHLARQLAGSDLRLVVVGPRDADEDRVRAAMALRDPEGRWTRRRQDVPEPELRRLYREAAVLVHPALQEGFGYPLVEAAAVGTPLVHTGGGALSELLGGVVPPTSAEPSAIATELLRILESDRVYAAESLRVAAAAGAYRLPIFAARWLDLLRRLADGGHR